MLTKKGKKQKILVKMKITILMFMGKKQLIGLAVGIMRRVREHFYGLAKEAKFMELDER